MKQYFDSIREQLRKELARGASDYLKTGLDLFHKGRRSSLLYVQPAIGNLAIAVELMLKTFVVKSNPLLLFKELPLELRILFTCPAAIPAKGFNWRQYDIDLRSFNYKTVELNELISTFYVFFSDHKQGLKPYFSLLSRCRNASIHSSLPSYQKYELERTAYLALRVFEVLDEHEKGIVGYFLRNEDQQFLSSFDEERAERVRKKVEAAKKESKQLSHRHVSIVSIEPYWDNYVTGCPICSSEGVVAGYTEVAAEQDGDGEWHPYLTFLAGTFECDECGLGLDDSEELRLAGMDIAYDRPDSDVDKWERETANTEDYLYGHNSFQDYYESLGEPGGPFKQ